MMIEFTLSAVPKTMDNNTLRQRALRRIAAVLYDFWEEARLESASCESGHTGIFDLLIRDEYIRLGPSRSLIKGDKFENEHLVPRKKLRNIAYKIFDDAGDRTVGIGQTTAMLDRCLRVAWIEKDKAKLLNRKRDDSFSLKDNMPMDWNYQSGCVFARLKAVGIELEWTELRYDKS